MRRLARLWITLWCVAAVTACDVSSGGPPGRSVPPTPAPSASPSPTPTQTPGLSAAIALSPSSLHFSAPAAPAQTVAVSENGYSGTFSVDGSACAGIATFALSVDTRTITVTPAGAGSCSATVHDTVGNTAPLPVSVSP